MSHQTQIVDYEEFDRDDYYHGNPNVKRHGVKHNYTEEQLREYIRCSKDPVYFAEKYCKVISLDRGLVPFELYPYQKEMFKHFEENRFNVVLACRQSGKSISSVAYLLWYGCFHPEKNIAILANKGSTSREMLGRITLMLENLPFFLQPGIKSLNKGSMEFSNNSKIFAASTSSSSIRGFSINLLYLDEFAFVERAAEFYTSTYPVITSGTTTKVIITSTANGIGNMFYKIWEGALQQTNSYRPFRVDWWDVPGRDEKWKAETIANTSEIQFEQEYGNTFFGTGDTLIDANTLMALRAKAPRARHGDVRVYEETQPGHEYVMTVDVGKGRGMDYSTFTIIDISTSPFQQVAVYQNNKISPLLFPDIIYKWATAYNEAYVIVESNDQGSVVCNGLYHELEYENIHLESVIKADRIGVEMTKKVKRIGCSGFKDILEAGGLEIHDEETIQEISTFEAKGQSFEASDGNHDDLVMNLVLFGYFAGTKFFSHMKDETLRKFLYEQKIRQIEDDVVPFGAIDDGRNELKEKLEVSNEWDVVEGHDWMPYHDDYQDPDLDIQDNWRPGPHW